MFYELNDAGNFICAALSEEGLDNWTVVPMPQPIYTPKFIGKRNAKTGEWAGAWVDLGEPEPDVIITERAWRDAELRRADIILNKVQDGMTGFGSVGPWRSYRVELRNWPENPEFPKIENRPVAPDAQ